MTNSWTDMANSSCFLIMGANPVENHPASFAHINAARAKGAQLVVIDPRKTRTACQVNPDIGDRYIRIRPGTDIAFLNGVIRRIIEKMEDDSDTTVSATQRSKFYEYLNWSGSGTFYDDGNAGQSRQRSAIPNSSKYTDARFLVKPDASDYEREQVADASGFTYSNVPKKVTTAAGVQSDPNTVYNRLKAHVDPYAPEVVAGICDCDASEVEFVAALYIRHSRCSSKASGETVPYVAGQQFGAGVQNPTLPGYKALTMLYAMGQTQHTYGAQNVKSFAVIQTLMGNMGRAGGGINALRGIHNVQGSTDMGLLYGNIPFYSGNPTMMTAATPADLATESTILAPGTIGGVAYYGFVEAMTADPRDASGVAVDASGYWVSVLANKDSAVPATDMTALDPTRWDLLVYRATNIADATKYAYKGRSDLITKATAAMADASGGIPLPGDFCYDGTRFRAYTQASTTGQLFEFTSPDCLVWTAATVYNTAFPANVPLYPSVVSNGTKTDVYYRDGAYNISRLELTVGNATPGAATVVVASSAGIQYVDPAIEKVAGRYTLTYQKYTSGTSTGIWQASATSATGPFTGAQLFDKDAYSSLDGLASAGGKVLFTPRVGSGPITTKSLNAISPITLRTLNAFGKYADTLWTNTLPLNGNAALSAMDGSYGAAYNTAAQGWQARGFFNMTYNWFGDPSWMTIADATGTSRTMTDGLYDLWPKTNGDDHVTMFRKAKAGTLTAMLVWGQNPAVTEPNQGAVRDGLKNLDLLTVVDLFETETAACDRKVGSTTYLIPACSHVEEAGSVTNSGRTLQWRERAALPKGNSKADLEIMLRLAKAFDEKGAFSHIKTQWTALGKAAGKTPYEVLYGDRYGYTPAPGAFEALSGTAEVWQGEEVAPTTATVNGSEWLTEVIYRELCAPTGGLTGVVLGTDPAFNLPGGTSWLYYEAFGYKSATVDPKAAYKVYGGDWQVFNRAKSRDNKNWGNQNQYHGWGYAWLANRRVFYNNSENPGDTGDFFMGPDSCSRLFVSTSTATLNYARWYRTIHRMADKPDVTITGKGYTNLASPHFIADASGNAVSFTGRFPGHTEPYETPRAALAATWGRNTKGGAQWDLCKSSTDVGGGTPIAGRDVPTAGFPFILTTIRCVEHFQGGPITRNNPWNVELEPEPWVEINSLDAAACNPPIRTGDLVQVTTARSNSTTDQNGRTIELSTSGAATASTFAQGFRARVGVGLAGNQRVGVGVVAIPWHWGDKGLSTGSRANDLCHDAGDANTVIPEYKALLCNIAKIS